MAQLAVAVATAGDRDRAALLAGEAEDLARVTHPDQHKMLTRLTEAVPIAGDSDRAEALTKQISDPVQRVEILARLVEVAAADGDRDRAAHLASEAKALTKQITDSHSREYALARLVKAATAGGDHDRAEALTKQISDPFQRMEILTLLVEAAIANGNSDRAARFADEAYVLSEGIITNPLQRWALTSFADPDRRVEALIRLAAATAACGDRDRTAQLADSAEPLTKQINDSNRRAEALAQLAGVLAEANKETALPPEHARSSSPLIVRARDLLATALVTGSWTEVIVGLARVDQLAVAVLANDLQTRWGLNAAAFQRDNRPLTIRRETGGWYRAPRWVRGFVRRVRGDS